VFDQFIGLALTGWSWGSCQPGDATQTRRAGEGQPQPSLARRAGVASASSHHPPNRLVRGMNCQAPDLGGTHERTAVLAPRGWPPQLHPRTLVGRPCSSGESGSSWSSSFYSTRAAPAPISLFVTNGFNVEAPNLFSWLWNLDYGHGIGARTLSWTGTGARRGRGPSRMTWRTTGARAWPRQRGRHSPEPRETPTGMDYMRSSVWMPSRSKLF
jgi:hypothetical protein